MIASRFYWPTFEPEHTSFAEMILRLARTDSSIGCPRSFGEKDAFLVLNDWREDQGFALKQRAIEALTTVFEEILQTHGMECLRAGFVSRLAAVSQAMEGLTGVADTVDFFLEWRRP
jgi:hypothetical protein